MNIYILLVVIFFTPLSQTEEIRLLNLDPPEAQQYIDRQPTDLKYAPQIDSNVPAVRYLGNEPHQVREDIYLANQYHGQDGLGGYLYGYAVPDIAKTEKKKAGGDLRGAYQYVAGNGQEIKVEYWDDGSGFHQVDNVPKIQPQQIDDTPEVKAAKEEHQRIWNEQAERNSRPIENPYDQTHNLVNQYQQQKQQFPNPGQNVHYQGGQFQGQPSQTVNKYQQASNSIPGQYGGPFGTQSSFGAAGSGGQSSGASGQAWSDQRDKLNTGSQGSGFNQNNVQPPSQQGPTGLIGQYGAGSGSSSGNQAGGGQFGGQSSGKFGSQQQKQQFPNPGQNVPYQGGQFQGQPSQNVNKYQQASNSFTGQAQSSAGQYGGPLGTQSSFGAAGSGGQYNPNKPSGGSVHGLYSGASQGSSGNQNKVQSPSQQGPTGLIGQYGGGSGSSLGNQAGAGQFGGQSSGKYGSHGVASSQAGSASAGVDQFSSGGGRFTNQGLGQASYQESGQPSNKYERQYISGGVSGSQDGQYGSGSGQYSGSYSSSASNEHSSQASGQYSGKYNEQDEEQGPPKGFFYNFDYPVGIIVGKDGNSIQKRDALQDIYTTNKAKYEKQLQGGHFDGSGKTSSSYLAV